MFLIILDEIKSDLSQRIVLFFPTNVFIDDSNTGEQITKKLRKIPRSNRFSNARWHEHETSSASVTLTCYISLIH